MKQARFLAAARLEYLAEVAYYSGIDGGLGLRFTDAVEEAASRALAFPLAGSPAEAGTRRVLLKDFPFSLVYYVVASRNSGHCPGSSGKEARLLAFAGTCPLGRERR